MRIRSIKPDFWSSEDVAQLNYFDRLLFIGLWSYVQDNGVGRDNTRLIVSQLFPLEEDVAAINELVDKGMAQIAAGGLIERYTVARRPYFRVRKWEHQKINRPTRSIYPFPSGFTEDSVRAHGGLSEGSVNPSTGSVDDPVDNPQTRRSGAHSVSPHDILTEGSLPGYGRREAGDGIRDRESVDGLVSHLQVVRADGKILTIDQKFVALIKDQIGGDDQHLMRVAKRILDRAPGTIRDVGAYVLAAVEEDTAEHRYTPRAPTKAEQCSKHPGQRATACASCAADRKAGDL